MCSHDAPAGACGSEPRARPRGPFDVWRLPDGWESHARPCGTGSRADSHLVAPARDGPEGCPACGRAHDLEGLPPSFVYLLGMYLGDGCPSAHPRGSSPHLLDARYPGIAEECERAIRAVMPLTASERSDTAPGTSCTPTRSLGRALFPQHGPGPKQTREIELTEWQRGHVARWPALLLRTVYSDGCRFQNTGRNWSHPRYSFANNSEGIKKIFCDACDLMGLH